MNLSYFSVQPTNNLNMQQTLTKLALELEQVIHAIKNKHNKLKNR